MKNGCRAQGPQPLEHAVHRRRQGIEACARPVVCGVAFPRTMASFLLRRINAVAL
jgi:hypothetical protein